MFLCMYECIAFVIGCFPLECVPFFLEICVGMTVKREIKVDKFSDLFLRDIFIADFILGVCYRASYRRWTMPLE